jgi:tetratricopeptide (TPR) repeat protein
MLDWAALAVGATLASSFLQEGGKYFFDTVSGGVVEAHGDKYFCQIVGNIVGRLKTENAPENHELVKAFRRACVKGMQHICARRKMIIGGDTSASLVSKSRNKLLGNAPTSIFAEDEKQWLDKAEAYLQRRIDELDQNTVWLPELPSETYYRLVIPQNVPGAVRADEFGKVLTTDALAELTAEVEAPPAEFVTEMETGWFVLVRNLFQEAIAENQLLANKFQNQTLVEIKSDTGEIKITLGEMLGLLREIAGRKEQPGAPVFVFNEPNLEVDVYDRADETKAVLDAMCRGEDKFYLVVAPSGFGKTFLLTKVLQPVVADKVITPEFAETVQRILVINCRNRKTLLQIVSAFRELSDALPEYAPESNETPAAWFKEKFFAALRPLGRIWLVLENFESWLDGARDYAVANAEVRQFLDALFEGSHNLRVLALSQSVPSGLSKFTRLREVGAALYDGLPEKDALDYLREKGAEVGLNKVDEKLLKEFLAKTHRIPQALSSIIGYLKSIEGYDFADVMRDLWGGFEDYEESREAGERRTKALIARQIEAQSPTVKMLLATLAYFGRAVPREALEALFINKAQAAPSIARLETHFFVTSKVGRRGTRRYELHAYFREQALKPEVLQLFENLPDEELENYAAKLIYLQGNEANNKNYFSRAIDLCECGIQIYSYLFEKRSRNDLEKHNEWADHLAKAYMKKGINLVNLGKRKEAVDEFEKAIAIYQRLVEKENRNEWADDLAMAYTNHGVTFISLGYLPEAVKEFDEAATIYRNLIEQESRYELTKDLAKVHLNKGIALRRLGKSEKAVDEYGKAITIYRRLVEEENHDELADDLAKAYTNHGASLLYLLKPSDAIVEFDKAISIYRRLIEEENRDELANDLAMAFMNNGVALVNVGKPNKAVDNYNKAISIYRRLIEEEGRDELASNLAMAYMNKGNTLVDLGKLSEAIDEYDNSERAGESCLQRREFHVLPEFVKNITNRIEQLIKLENWERTSDSAIKALDWAVLAFENNEFSNYFKQQIGELIHRIHYFLRQLSRDDLEKIYAAAGVKGEALRLFVETNQ